MSLRSVAIVLAFAALLGAAAPGGASGAAADPLAARSDSLRALAASKTDSVSKAAPSGDSSSAALDSARTGLRGAASDSAARKRALPPRTLTLRQQVMFAGGFMAFLAVMMTSMQNFNP